MTYFVLLLISVVADFFSRRASRRMIQFFFSSVCALRFRLISLQNNDMASSELAKHWDGAGATAAEQKKQVIGLMRLNGFAVVRRCCRDAVGVSDHLLCVCLSHVFSIRNCIFQFPECAVMHDTLHNALRVYALGKRVQPEIAIVCAWQTFPLAQQLRFSSKTWRCLQLKKK